jgi:hypothetical protein
MRPAAAASLPGYLRSALPGAAEATLSAAGTDDSPAPTPYFSTGQRATLIEVVVLSVLGACVVMCCVHGTLRAVAKRRKFLFVAPPPEEDSESEYETDTEASTSLMSDES